MSNLVRFEFKKFVGILKIKTIFSPLGLVGHSTSGGKKLFPPIRKIFNLIIRRIRLFLYLLLIIEKIIFWTRSFITVI